VIAPDMGRARLTVAVIEDGRLENAREPLVDRYHYVAPKIDLMSIGAGGGSIVGVDHRTRRPTIGPASAGARPGPICYGLGGNKPTLTDIAAILGYMDPGTFLGGTLRLDIEPARQVFADVIARPLGMDVDAAALGIYQVAVARIADLIRNVTVERGLDPREFALQSFGGSGGLFAGAYAQDLSIGRVIVPHTAAVLCAFGMVAADVLHDRSVVYPLSLPVDPKEVDARAHPDGGACSGAARRRGLCQRPDCAGMAGRDALPASGASSEHALAGRSSSNASGTGATADRF
jgi:N-methylhydantoinase A